MSNKEKIIEQIRGRQFEQIKEDRKKQILGELRSYKRGFSSEKERDAAIRGIIGDNLFDLLNILGLKSMSYEQSKSFCEDYKNWKNGDPITGEWYESDMVGEAFNESPEAFNLSQEDILQCVAALYVPVSYFKQLPPEIPDPGLIAIHAYSNEAIWGVNFNYVENDGGLFSETDPIGKEYHITRSDGVRLHLKVSAFRKKGEKYKERNFELEENSDLHYEGIGSIDDYYFRIYNPNRDNIRFGVNFKKDRIEAEAIVSVCRPTEMKIDGLTDMSIDFPRWEKYNQFRKNREKEIEEEFKELIDSFSV